MSKETSKKHKKDFLLPDEVAQIMIDATIAEEKLPEIIVKCMSEITKKQQVFWDTAMQIYPELSGEKLIFDHKTKIIKIKEIENGIIK